MILGKHSRDLCKEVSQNSFKSKILIVPPLAWGIESFWQSVNSLERRVIDKIPHS